MRKLKTERRPEILDAALAVADEGGLEALTMRAVAERIDLTPMALYGYFRSKDDLLDGLVGRLLAELPVPDPALDWDERLRILARGIRALARQHPAVIGLLLDRPSVTVDAARVVDVLYQALLDAGVPPQAVPRIERLVSTVALGFAVSEVRGRFAARSPDSRAGRGERDAEELPAHHRLADVLEADVDWDGEYESDLTDLTDLIRFVVANRSIGGR